LLERELILICLGCNTNFEQKLTNGKVIKEETEGIKHYATLEQIHGWLSNAGFIVEFEYEDFDKNPINDESKSVIIYAKKADDITYVPIDEAIEQKIIAWFGDGIKKYDMLPNRDGCYRIAAMCGEQVIGFTAVAPARWKPPLEQYGFSLPPRNRVVSMLPIAASRKNILNFAYGRWFFCGFAVKIKIRIYCFSRHFVV